MKSTGKIKIPPVSVHRSPQGAVRLSRVSKSNTAAGKHLPDSRNSEPRSRNRDPTSLNPRNSPSGVARLNTPPHAIAITLREIAPSYRAIHFRHPEIDFGTRDTDQYYVGNEQSRT
jgi:hypothetical protein